MKCNKPIECNFVRRNIFCRTGEGQCTVGLFGALETITNSSPSVNDAVVLDDLSRVVVDLYSLGE